MLLNLQVILRDFLKEEVIALTWWRGDWKKNTGWGKETQQNKQKPKAENKMKIKKAREKINEIKQKKCLICFFFFLSNT